MSINKIRITAEQAGYLELPGATKDGDCTIVEVDGGISKDRGCCNSYGWRSRNPKNFSCGECKYLEDEGEQYEQEDGKPRPISKREASKMSDEELINSDRPVFGRTEKE